MRVSSQVDNDASRVLVLSTRPFHLLAINQSLFNPAAQYSNAVERDKRDKLAGQTNSVIFALKSKAVGLQHNNKLTTVK